MSVWEYAAAASKDAVEDAVDLADRTSPETVYCRAGNGTMSLFVAILPRSSPLYFDQAPPFTWIQIGGHRATTVFFLDYNP